MLYLLLALILAAGFALRTWNINFDRGIGSHPDERSTACFYAPTIQLPDSWESFKDPRQSPMNPLWDVARQERRGFTYGHLPLYMGVAMGELFHRVAPIAERLGAPEETVSLMARADHACDGIAVAGRLTMALLDTLTILLLFLLGRKIYSPTTGLIAAGFYAFTAQAIQLSHFFAMDPASTTFTVLAVLGGVKMIQDRSTGAALLTGVAAGLAISSKFSALPVLAVPVVAAVIVFWDVAQQRAVSGVTDNASRDELRALAGIPISFLFAAVTFAVTSPYAVLDWMSFINATLIEQGRMVRGVADFPFTRQYRNTVPYLYFIDQQLRWGIGLALGSVAAAGVLVAGVECVRTFYAMAATVISRLFSHDQWRAVPRVRQAELIVWAWVVPYFGLTGAFLAKFNRYMLPLLPFVMLFAAGMIWRLWRMGSVKRVSRGEEWGSGAVENRVMPLNAETASVSESATRDAETTIATQAASSKQQAAEVLDNSVPQPATLNTETTASHQAASSKQQAASTNDAARTAQQRAARILAVSLATLGLVGGLFWSLAYVNGVYGREHTWISASRWIYENVPEGSAILWEVWDDPLPKSIPGEAGMDMGSTGLYNIDWSPYEEDTAPKYELMRAKLKEADYVAYSSKRIYDSVDELPERYPMTNLYYESMWDGSLGFELALDQTSPPSLFGIEFDDRHADESWSLYDHPQATIFRKVRQLSDAEYDALFAGTWEEAVPWYRGKDSPLSPLLSMIGLDSSPESESEGLLNRIIGLVSGHESDLIGGAEVDIDDRASLELAAPLDQMPLVDNYRWNQLASENSGIAVIWWWFVMALLGWIAWPYAFGIFRPLRDRGYLFSRSLGWLVSGWLLWWMASLGWMQNSVRGAWSVVLLLGIGGALLAYRQRQSLGRYLRRNWGLIVCAELLFAVAFGLFVVIRLFNPDLWQPWFGGEKFMEFAFLNGILRSPTFPPLDPHFAGGQINYYYFGIYLVAYLIKLTGIYAEVAFNLAVPTLFALTVSNAFAVAYSAVRDRRPAESGLVASDPGTQYSESVDQSPHDVADPEEGKLPPGNLSADQEGVPTVDELPVASDAQLATEAPVAQPTQPAEGAMADEGEDCPDTGDEPVDRAGWRHGILIALLAPLFVTILGNLDGFAQLVRSSARVGASTFSSTVPGLDGIVRAVSAISSDPSLPAYDFWGPSRVIPSTINEFPFWSFLFADLHPHLIGIPFSLLFLGILLALFLEPTDWNEQRLRGGALLALLSLMLGTLATVNLWELPTYLGLGLLAFMVSQFYQTGRVRMGRTLLFAALYLLGAFLAYWPFFGTYQNIGASGLGLVREGDALGIWLLIWGLFLFVLTSWIFFAASRSAGPRWTEAGQRVRPTGIERTLSMTLRRFDRLPRVLYLQRLIVKQSTLGYELARWIVPLTLLAAAVALWMDRAVLALCLSLLGLAFLLLWRRGREADAGSIFVALLTVTGLAILAGTQVVYLKDFLQGGDWYRMNTLFKFFSQVWVIWGVAAAIALPRLWSGFVSKKAQPVDGAVTSKRIWRYAWAVLLVLLIAASLAYPLLGTPARVDQRLNGWRPPPGTLNGLAYMEQGTYTWPDAGNVVELEYDWAAIQWLLDNVRGNPVLVESAEVDYYRAGGTRVASLTGLSGLRGMHASEQRYGDLVGERDGLHREFWNTADVDRTIELMDELDVALIYVGQLEQHQHRAGVEKLENMASEGLLVPIYSNERVIIYAVPGELAQDDDGGYRPS